MNRNPMTTKRTRKKQKKERKNPLPEGWGDLEKGAWYCPNIPECGFFTSFAKDLQNGETVSLPDPLCPTCETPLAYSEQ